MLKVKLNESVVRGQHGGGNIDGVKVVPYRSERGIARDSVTETFVALKLFIDNLRTDNLTSPY